MPAFPISDYVQPQVLEQTSPPETHHIVVDDSGAIYIDGQRTTIEQLQSRIKELDSILRQREKDGQNAQSTPTTQPPH